MTIALVIDTLGLLPGVAVAAFVLISACGIAGGLLIFRRITGL